MTALPQDPHVGLVVEGAGDVLALPILLRAHLIGVGEYRDVVGKPVPLSTSRTAADCMRSNGRCDRRPTPSLSGNPASWRESTWAWRAPGR